MAAIDMDTVKDWAPYIPAAAYLLYHSLSLLTNKAESKTEPYIPFVELATVASLAAPQYVPKAVAVNLMTGLVSGMVAKRQDKVALGCGLALLAGVYRDSK